MKQQKHKRKETFSLLLVSNTGNDTKHSVLSLRTLRLIIVLMLLICATFAWTIFRSGTHFKSESELRQRLTTSEQQVKQLESEKETLSAQAAALAEENELYRQAEIMSAEMAETGESTREETPKDTTIPGQYPPTASDLSKEPYSEGYNWGKYIVRIVILIGAVFMFFAIVKPLLRKLPLYDSFSIKDIYKYALFHKRTAEESSFEQDFDCSEFDTEISPDNEIFDNMQEQHHTNEVLEQDVLENSQEPLQRETSFTGAEEGMLLVLDIPIQRNKILLDKIRVEKNMVTVPVNGGNMQIDVSCKKFEMMADINFEHCKKYDIKRGTLPYVIVAVIEYCINIWSKEWNENAENACEKLNIQLNQKLNPYGIKTSLSGKGCLFFENKVLITFEDVLYLLSSKAV